MKRFFNSVSNNIQNLFTDHLLLPLSISAIVLIAYIIICKIKNKNIIKRRALSLFLFSFYFSLIFDITLFCRIGSNSDPLSNIYGDWWVWDTDLIYYVNFSPIVNLVITLPLCFVVFYFIKQFTYKTYSNKCMIICSTIISFILSLFIETMQLIFCIGTFQISDLVYNTFGGTIGSFIFITLITLIKKKKKGT